MNKKIRFLTLALCIFFALCFIVGCGDKQDQLPPDPPDDKVTAPSVSKSLYDYDKTKGGDLSVTVYLNFGSLVSFKVKDGAEVDKNLYRYTSQSDILLLKEELLISLEIGNNIFTVYNEKGSVDFTVAVQESPLAEFDAVSTKSYVYGSMRDVNFTADFKGYKVSAMKQGENLLGTDHYAVTDSGVMIRASYLENKCGKLDFSVALENGQEFPFSIVTNNIFVADFDANTPTLAWTANNDLKTENGIEGKSARISGSSGSILLIGKPFYDTAVFEKDKTYTVSFDMKNMKTDATVGKMHFLTDGVVDVTKKDVLTFDYLTGEAAGESEPYVTYDETNQVYHIEFRFVGRGEGYSEIFIDHGQTSYDILIDNIRVYEQMALPEIDPVLAEFDVGAPADVEFDADLKSDLISILLNDQELSADEYIVEENIFKIKASVFTEAEVGDVYNFSMKTINGTIRFQVIAVDNSQSVTATTTSAGYVLGSGIDVSFALTVTEGATLTVKEMKVDEKIIAAGNYAFTISGTDATLLIKSALLEKMGQCAIFAVTFTNGQSIRFTVTNNSVFFSDFDFVSIDPATWCIGNTATIVADGIEGNSVRFSGNSGSILLLGAPFYSYTFEKGVTYRVGFDLKNMKADATNGKLHFLTDGVNGSTRADVLTFDYLLGEAAGDSKPVLSYDRETGVYHIEFSFVGRGEGYTEIYIDHAQTGYDILMDNISVYKQLPLAEIEDYTEYNLLDPEDLVLDVIYNSELISVSMNERLLVKGTDFTVETNKLILKKALLADCNNDETINFVLRTVNGPISFTVKTVELNFIATFDTVKEKEHYQGTDVGFTLILNSEITIESIQTGSTDIAASYYDYDAAAQKIVLKAAYLDYVPTQEYLLALSNGQSFLFTVHTQTLIAFDYDQFLPMNNSYNLCENPVTAEGSSGNGFSISKPEGAWGSVLLFGDAFYPATFTAGEFYQMEFDVRANESTVPNTINFDVSAANVKTVFFAINLSTGEYDFRNGGVGSVVKDADGWYHISIVFKMNNATGFTEFEPVSAYNFTIDNVRLSVLDKSKSELPVHATAISVTANGTALNTDDYSVSEGMMTLNQTVIDSFTAPNNLIEVTFEDGSVRRYVLSKDIIIFHDNFDDEGSVIPETFCNDATFGVETGWDGRAMRMSGKSGNLFLFGSGWAGSPVTYVAGITYRLSFELKNMGDQLTLNFKGDGDNTYTMALNVKDHAGTGCTVSYNEITGVMSVSTEFVAKGTGFSQMFPSDFGDGFDIMIDNITITELA